MTPDSQSIALSPALMAEVEAAANEENRPVADVLRDAVKHYVEERAWKKIFAYGEERAKALGLTEEDVPRLIAESRAEHRQRQE